MSPLRLPLGARLLWVAMLASGLLSLVDAAPPSLAVLAAWIPVLGLSEAFWIRTSGRQATISTAMVAHLAAIRLLPTGQAAFMAFVVSFAADILIQRKPVIKAAYNASLVAITLRLAAIPILLARLAPASHLEAAAWVGFAGAGIVYWLVNRAGVTCIIAASEEISWSRAWRENFGFGYEALTTSVQLVLAGVLAAGWQVLGPSGLAGMALLCYFVTDAYRRRNQLEKLRTEVEEERKAA